MKAQLHKIDPTSITNLKLAHEGLITLEWDAPESYTDGWTANVYGAGLHVGGRHNGQIVVTQRPSARDLFEASHFGVEPEAEYTFKTTTDLTAAIIFAAFGPEGPAYDRMMLAEAAELAEDARIHNYVPNIEWTVPAGPEDASVVALRVMQESDAFVADNARRAQPVSPVEMDDDDYAAWQRMTRNTTRMIAPPVSMQIAQRNTVQAELVATVEHFTARQTS